ncbi:hypothetical protein [Vibrio phage BUCT194]|uniref:Uncharacterized protein n=1 Tax=Vibrio phage BUCT194 TaxID=2859072 RepID=A0AAE8XF26_9CAUD|nr:hypothetical protein PP741_gp006 [Vibrio phage BUCT194]UAW01113.1 hypothetical protein [Vibrio phage BUCT194]
MEILVNQQTRCVYFKISGRSTGGTSKMEHITESINLYRQHFNTPGYVSIQIQLEDGLINPMTAKNIISGYKRAAYKMELLTRMNGGNITVDLGFIRL